MVVAGGGAERGHGDPVCAPAREHTPTVARSSGGASWPGMDSSGTWTRFSPPVPPFTARSDSGSAGAAVSRGVAGKLFPASDAKSVMISIEWMRRLLPGVLGFSFFMLF